MGLDNSSFNSASRTPTVQNDFIDKLLQNIPSLLSQDHSTSQVIGTLLGGTVGTLLAAMLSTLGIYLIASIIYVRVSIISVVGPILTSHLVCCILG